MCLLARAVPAQRPPLWSTGVLRHHGNVPLAIRQQQRHPDLTHAHIKTFPSASVSRWLPCETTVAMETLHARKCSATLFKCDVSVPGRAELIFGMKTKYQE